MGKLHIIDVSIVGIYLFLCLAIGLYKSTKIKTIREYTVGSGNFPLIALVATNFATYISARSTMGDVTEIFQSGLIYGIPVLLCFLSWLITSKLYITNIYQFKNCISLSEIMYELYGGLALHVTNFCSIVLSIGFVTTQMLAIGYLFQEYFQIQYHIGVIIGFSILTFYSAFGGIRGVVLTDILQFFIFFCALPIICGFLYYEVGGYSKIKESLPKSHLESFLTKDTMLLFVGYIFYTIIPLHSAPYIQRLLMSTNQEKLKKTYNICAFLTLIFSILILLIGLMMRAKAPGIEPNLVFYYFINNYLPPVLKSILLIGILAIIMSTADSWLNNASAIIAHDVAKKINSNITNKQEIRIAIIATFSISLLCTICAFWVDSILKAIFMVFNFWVPIILIPLTAGFLKFRTNSTAFLYSVIMAILLCLLGRYISSDFGVISMTTGTIGSAIGLFFGHYWQVKRGIIKVKKPSHKEYKPTLNQKIKQLIDSFLALKKKVEVSKSSYYTFALFIMTLNIPILILGYNASYDFVNVTAQYLRYATLFLALFVMFHEIYSTKNPNILWNLTLFLALPFTGVYLFIASGYNVIWGANCFVSIIALFLFANLYYAWILGISGVLAAITLHVGYNWIVDPIIIVDKQNLFATYSTILLSAIITYVIYHKFREDKIKQKALEILGRSIAHDVTSPLTINLLSMELIKQSLKDKDYKNIDKHIHNLEQCNKQAMQDVDIMLSSIKADDSIKPKDWGEYSIIKCVSDALDKYFMNEEQRKQVSILDKDNKKKDFTFIGSNTLLCHVIFNLLKNALKYAGDKAKIEIFIKNSKLHFKDDGYGIEEEVLTNLFQKYATTGGHGVGLNFCKEAMRKMGGNITCNSVKGKGAEFIINFNVPHIRKKK